MTGPVESNGLRSLLKLLGPLKNSTVLSADTDPFRLDTPANHRDSEWLRDAMAESGLDREIHNRGLHYALHGQPKPDGTKYGDTSDAEEREKEYNWLIGVSVAARWLDYIPWEQIKDERNSEPVFRLWTPPQPKGYVSTDPYLYVPDADDLTPKAALADFRGSQPYHLAIIGEKSSLEDVLGPIAEEYEADLYLPTGNISNRRIWELAANANNDGRPLVTLYFSDCDPSGWHMPTEVARKLQALQLLRFPKLEFRCYQIGLTPKQVKAFKDAKQPLPESPVKDSDKRAAKWERQMQVGQIEIDALATLQPNVLTDLTIDFIERGGCYDTSLAERVDAAREDWERRAQVAVDEQTDRHALNEALAELERKREEIEAILDTLQDDDDFDLPERPEIPAAVVNPSAQPLPLFDSNWDFVEQTERLMARRNYEFENE